MTTTWGALAKSQVDSETIEEAIARLVAEHEADPEAHLSATGSMQSHKASEIIDHIAGSVVADKMGMSEVVAKTTFESIDGWFETGAPKQLEWPGLEMHSETTLNATGYLYQQDVGLFGEGDEFKNLMFQVSVKFGSLSYADYILAIGNPDGGANENGIGFITISDHLYGWLHNWGNDTTVDLGAISNDTDYVLRFWCDAVNEVINFYVNGVLIDNIAFPTWGGTTGFRITFRIKNKSNGNTTSMRLRELRISRDM